VTLREIPGASTHTAIVADGLEQSYVSVALGRYLVGALAGIVGEDTRLTAVMLEEGPDARAERGRSPIWAGWCVLRRSRTGCSPGRSPFLNALTNSSVTLRSARALIRCTVEISSSTSVSVPR